MGKLVDLYKASHLGNRLPAYDGRKSLYTAGPLPFPSKEFKITLIDEDDGSGGQRYRFNADFLSTHHMYVLIFLYAVCAEYYCLCAGERGNSRSS